MKIKSISQGEANDSLNAESSSHSDGVAIEESRMMITSGDPQPCCSKRMDATEVSEEHGPPRKVQKVKRSRKSGKLHKLIARAIDCKAVAFFSKSV